MVSSLINVNFGSFEQCAADFGSIHGRVGSSLDKVKTANQSLASGWTKDGAPACKDIAEACEKHFSQIYSILETEKQSITQAANIYDESDRSAGNQF